MPFSHLLKDNVSLLKKDGTVVDGIKARVQEKKIIIMGADIIIESGDLIQHKLYNGNEETYEVIDPGFYEEVEGIKAHYQMTHRKLTLPEIKQAQQDISEPDAVAHKKSNVSEHLSILRQEIKRLANPGQE